ncbi:MAG: FtsX-like permease family protein [Reichenbachiella sp.]
MDSSNQNKFSHSWLLKMAWRDSRRSRSKLFLFSASIIVGIAALVGINSFKENLDDEIQSQAKTLLGADLELNTRQVWNEEQRGFLDSVGSDYSTEVRFASMVYFPSTQGTRLVQVRALEGAFPYYGTIETDPPQATSKMDQGKHALVDEKLMLQYTVNIGDLIKIGRTEFKIVGKLKSVPGQSGIGTAVSPLVYIPHSQLADTELILQGSRAVHAYYFQRDNLEKLNTWIEESKDRMSDLTINYNTVEERKESTSKAFGNLNVFLNMTAFIALLLGSIGVSGAVFIYLKEKSQSVAVLRCLGLKGRDAFLIFFYQVLIMGFIGSVLGSGLGIVIQFYLPQLVEDILPIAFETKLYWTVALQGLVLGLVISILFSLLPLVSLVKISPLMSIREDFQTNSGKKIDYTKISIYAGILLFLYLFSFVQIGEWKEALYFVVGLAVTLLLLLALAKGLVYLAKKSSSNYSSFNIKQGLANLHRPNNQTTILTLTIGTCVVLLSMLYYSKDLLVEEITLSGSGDRPNMVLFDIQTDQKESIQQLTKKFNLPIIQDVPVVTMRLKTIKGISKKQAQQDSTLEIPEWLYNREYRVTFRDSLIVSETLTDGELQKNVVPGDSIFITVSEGFAKGRDWEVGDEIEFNVQGALMTTYIGGLRKIDWRRVQTNFIILFPTGVLEQAPQFHVLVTKTDTPEVSAKYQQAIVRLFPNVSIVDLELILKTVEEVLTKISFVIRFMAMFSIITGIIVLAGSIVLSKTQRVKESVLLRTLGASSKQIILITIVEYFTLGAISALSGLILANIFTWALTQYVFESTYLFLTEPTIVIFFAISIGTVLLGISNIRPVLSQSPLAILRKEQ